MEVVGEVSKGLGKAEGRLDRPQSYMEEKPGILVVALCMIRESIDVLIVGRSPYL